MLDDDFADRLFVTTPIEFGTNNDLQKIGRRCRLYFTVGFQGGLNYGLLQHIDCSKSSVLEDSPTQHPYL
jgi:hypothetical protein